VRRVEEENAERQQPTPMTVKPVVMTVATAGEPTAVRIRKMKGLEEAIMSSTGGITI